jgi:lipoyl-dependent peroxiredoxin subunit D
MRPLLFLKDTSMALEHLLESIPDYAKDLRLNWSSLLSGSDLTDTQKWGTVIASAYVSRNPALLEAISEDAAKAGVSAEVINAAKGAAAIMGMNNIYYRFQHLTTNENYSTMPARLRMNIMRTHGADAVDFELWSIAASAINGCGKCVHAHEKTVREKGVSEEVILHVIRLASVVHGIAAVLDSERVAEPVAS